MITNVLCFTPTLLSFTNSIHWQHLVLPTCFKCRRSCMVLKEKQPPVQLSSCERCRTDGRWTYHFSVIPTSMRSAAWTHQAQFRSRWGSIGPGVGITLTCPETFFHSDKDSARCLHTAQHNHSPGLLLPDTQVCVEVHPKERCLFLQLKTLRKVPVKGTTGKFQNFLWSCFKEWFCGEHCVLQGVFFMSLPENGCYWM